MNNSKEGKEPNFFKNVKRGFLRAIITLVRYREVSVIEAFFMITISFIQLYGSLFVRDGYLSWEGDLFGSFIYNLASQSQLVPYIYETKSVIAYYTLFILSMFI